MNNARFSLLLFTGLAFTLSGCGAVVGIFETGFWSGIVLVILVALLIIYLVRSGRKD